MAGIAMGLKCPVCATEDRADPERWVCEIRQQSRRGGVLFGPPPRRGSLGYHLRQVRHRRHFLMEAKNHAVATRRLLGQAPGDIQTLRKREGISQAVLARCLNLTTGQVSQLERGAKHARGATLKLLCLIEKKGLEVVL